MEKEDIFLRRRQKKRRRKRRKIFGEGKYIFCRAKKNGEGKGGIYFEKETVFLWTRKGRKIFGEGKLMATPTN